MASKKSIYSGLLLLTLTLGAFVPVTSFADDGIATNDAVLTQPTTDRAVTGPSTAPSDGDLARSNDSNTGAATPTTPTPTVPEVPAEPTTPATPETPATPAPTADSSTKPADKPTEKPADKPEDPASATDKGTSEAPQNPETPAVNVNGFSRTLSRRINFLSPSSAFCSTRERFSDTKAISDAEKKAVSKVNISNKID